MQTRSKTKNKAKVTVANNSSSKRSTPHFNTSNPLPSRIPRRPRTTIHTRPIRYNIQPNSESMDNYEENLRQVPPQGQPERPRRAVNAERTVGEYITPTLGNYKSPIYVPDGEGYDFDAKGVLIQMIKGDQFDGEGNPNHHLSNFTEMCRACKTPGIPQEVVFMKMFPFSLTYKARDWLQSHEPNTFRTWEQLAQAFINQYFPPAKTKAIRGKISKFVQLDNEPFHEAYVRFKGLIRDCPHHGFDKWELLSAFYDGMDENSRARMDQVSGGGIMDLTPTEGFELVEKIARNSHQWGGERNQLKKDEREPRSKAITKEDFNELAKTVNALAQSLGNQNLNKKKDHANVFEVGEYNQDGESQGEDVHYIARGQDRYVPPPIQNQQRQVRFYPDAKPSTSTSYYNTQNQPRNQYQGGNQSKGQYFNSNANHNYKFNSDQNYSLRQGDKKQDEPSLTQLMAQLIASQEQQRKDMNSGFQNLNSEIQQMKAAHKMLETQVAQQAASSSRNSGRLPSQPDVKSADVNAITLKSGKELEGPKAKEKTPSKVVEEDEQQKDIQPEPEKEKAVEEEEKEPYVAPPAYVPPLPFPQRQRKVKENAAFKRFAEILGRLNVTIPFLK